MKTETVQFVCVCLWCIGTVDICNIHLKEGEKTNAVDNILTLTATTTPTAKSTAFTFTFSASMSATPAKVRASNKMQAATTAY